MNDNKNYRIYLTGFMGSGKSTIAPILANTLGFTFVDIDREIETLTGKEISEIFSDLGEEYFREVESSVLLEVSHRDRCVISLGGGTITNEANLQIIKSTGVLIYLKTSAEQIYHRLKRKTDRPLVRSKIGATLNEEQLRNRISVLLSKREQFYNQADVIVITDDQRIGLTVDEIVQNLKNLIR